MMKDLWQWFVGNLGAPFAGFINRKLTNIACYVHNETESIPAVMIALVVILFVSGGLALSLTPILSQTVALAKIESIAPVTSLITVTPKPATFSPIPYSTDTPTATATSEPSKTPRPSSDNELTPSPTLTSTPLPPTFTPTPTPPPPLPPITPTPPCFGEYEDFYFISPQNDAELPASFIALRIHISPQLKTETVFYEIRYVLNRSGRTINADHWNIDSTIGREMIPTDQDQDEIIVYWKPTKKGNYRLLPLFWDESGQFFTDKSCAIRITIK